MEMVRPRDTLAVQVYGGWLHMERTVQEGNTGGILM
jgi:hypothetical protein